MGNKVIGTEVKLLGEKEFNAQTKAMGNGLKTLKSDMAAVSAEFNDNADSVEALTAKQKVLQDGVAQHGAKVEFLKAQYEAASKALGENASRTQEIRREMNFASAAYSKEIALLGRVTEALNKAKEESDSYVPITRKLATALKKPGEAFEDLKKEIEDAVHELPVFAEMADLASAGAKGLSIAAKGAGTTIKGIGTAAGGIAKGIGAVSAAAAAGVAAIGAGGVMALTAMVSMARETAEAAKAAQEAGETLTASQEQWLAYSNQLDALDSSVANAKSALAGILLPVLGELSTEGAEYLNGFARDMEAAAGDTGKQTKVLADYITKGAKLIMEKLPEYIKLGKELFSGLGEGLKESGPELLDMGSELVMDLLDSIIENAPDLAEAGTSLIQAMLEGLSEKGPDVLTSAVGMVSQIVSGLGQAAPQMIPAAARLVVQLITALAESAPQLLLAGLELIFGIISGLKDGLGEIVNSAGVIIETLKNSFAEKADEILSIGGDIVRGIWQGISDGTEWIYGKITEWVDDVLAWIQKKLGISSPSSLMEHKVGFWMARGVGVGWQKEMQNVNRLIADSINTSFEVPEISVRSRGYSGRNYTTANGKTVNLYFYAKTMTEADINMVVEIVNRRLGDDL